MERRVRLWSLAASFGDGEPVGLGNVCSAAIAATQTDGAAVAVALSATPRQTIYSSDEAAARAEELGLTLGEGPGVDALHGVLVLVPDLGTVQCQARWPAFAPAALDLGVRSVFALPLRVGAVRLGVLDLYRSAPGDLDQEQLLDALVLADTACALLLDVGQHPASGGPPEAAGLPHPEVHQATGMITVQLGLSASVALTRLRAYAYAHDRSLHDVARDVVARRLRFGADDQLHEQDDDHDDRA